MLVWCGNHLENITQYIYNLPEFKSYHDQVVLTVLLLYECHVNDITSRWSLYSDMLFTLLFLLYVFVYKCSEIQTTMVVVVNSAVVDEEMHIELFCYQKIHTKLGRF